MRAIGMRIGQVEKARCPISSAPLEVQPDDCQAPLLLYQSLRALGRGEEGEQYARMGLKRAEEALRQLSRKLASGAAWRRGAGRLGEIGSGQAHGWNGRSRIDPDDTHIAI